MFVWNTQGWRISDTVTVICVCFWGHWKRFFDVDKDVGHIAVFSPQLLGTVKYNGLISGEDVFFPVSSAAPIQMNKADVILHEYFGLTTITDHFKRDKSSTTKLKNSLKKLKPWSVSPLGSDNAKKISKSNYMARTACHTMRRFPVIKTNCIKWHIFSYTIRQLHWKLFSQSSTVN